MSVARFISVSSAAAHMQCDLTCFILPTPAFRRRCKKSCEHLWLDVSYKQHILCEVWANQDALFDFCIKGPLHYVSFCKGHTRYTVVPSLAFKSSSRETLFCDERTA